MVVVSALFVVLIFYEGLLLVMLNDRVCGGFMRDVCDRNKDIVLCVWILIRTRCYV